jgi:hypothetical protein
LYKVGLGGWCESSPMKSLVLKRIVTQNDVGTEVGFATVN